MESVEASGKSIEDAILQALVRLGRNRDEVDITVLQEPSRGSRGMGAREARVRVRLKPSRAAAQQPLPDEDELDQGEFGDGYEDESPEYPDGGAPMPYDEQQDAAWPVDAEPVEIPTAPLRELLPDDASIEEIAVAALEAILAHMAMPALVEVVEPLSEETAEEEPLTLNIRTQSEQALSLLIGRRGETLSALQLLVNLIVAKQTGHHERIIVDAEGYRLRREDNLRSMAMRVAAQVRRSGHPITLEAMPPNERRIVHMTLAEIDDIGTESTGEGDQRRVVVSLKKAPRG
ncbi:MAG TPA: RNA-binding cell elongation regulator Jag/EloR [Ktedonobacterales bacterium]